MTVHHQISDGLLAAYAAGSLSEGWSIAVATHLALCPESRARLSRFEACAADMLENLEPDTSGVDDAWAALQSRMRQTSASGTRQPAKPPASVGVLPEPLRSYAGSDADGLKWKALGRGAYQIVLPTADHETTVRLLRIPAGKPVPEHGHGGRELTLVLDGSFLDGDKLFARGDIEETDENLEHQPVATPDRDCICLAVTDAPLRFKSRLMRTLQPLLGI